MLTCMFHTWNLDIHTCWNNRFLYVTYMHPYKTTCKKHVRCIYAWMCVFVEFYLYPTVGTVLIHSVKPVTKAPGRAVATEGRCVRAGSKWESTPLCLQQFHQFVQLVRISISTRCDQSSVRSYILLQCYCYTESPLCSLLETANQPDAAPAGSLM